MRVIDEKKTLTRNLILKFDPSVNMEETGLKIYIAVSQQRLMEVVWLHLWAAILTSTFNAVLDSYTASRTMLVIEFLQY